MQSADIVIIGAGSVGLTLANLLGGFGVHTIVIEREESRADVPRAVGIDDESLRIWQAAGVLEKILPHVAFGSEGDAVLTYLTSRHEPFFAIHQIGKPLGFPRGATFVQQLVDEELEHGLARFPNVHLLRGLNVKDIEQDGAGAKVITLGGDIELAFRCQYIVACDGARSPTRERLGVPFDGFTYPNRWLVVDGLEPRGHPEKITRGVEVWTDPSRPTASVPLPHGLRRWEFLLRDDEAEHDALTYKFIHQLLPSRGGGPQVQIVRRAVHRFSARVARTYRAGRIFLAGDAAHTTPPFAAQGLASGLRDAANLSWKLAWVVSGRAESRLLDTYEIERRPHQQRMLRLAVNLGRLMMPQNRLQETIVASAIRLATRVPWIREAMSMRGSALQPIYSRGCVGSGLLAGRYLPQPRVRLADGRTCLLDEVLGRGMAVVGLDVVAEKVLDSQTLSWLKSVGASFVCITRDKVDDSGAVQDLDGLFAAALAGWRQRLFVVRPDRFILADAAPEDANEISRRCAGRGLLT